MNDSIQIKIQWAYEFTSADDRLYADAIVVLFEAPVHYLYSYVYHDSTGEDTTIRCC